MKYQICYSSYLWQCLYFCGVRSFILYFCGVNHLFIINSHKTGQLVIGKQFYAVCVMGLPLDDYGGGSHFALLWKKDQSVWIINSIQSCAHKFYSGLAVHFACYEYFLVFHYNHHHHYHLTWGWLALTMPFTLSWDMDIAAG